MSDENICFRFAKNGSCRFGDRCRFKHVAGETPNKKPKKVKSKRRKGGPKPKRDSKDHIAEFFALYPEYPYDATAPFMDEFYAMCDFFDWPNDSDDREERDLARSRLSDAMVKQFNNFYGVDVDDLVAWQSLCKALGLDPIPSELKKCQQVVMRVHVNICDLVDAPSRGKPTLFPTEIALASYTRSTGRFFPRDNIHAGSLLRYLLRHILNPGIGSRRG